MHQNLDRSQESDFKVFPIVDPHLFEATTSSDSINSSYFDGHVGLIKPESKEERIVVEDGGWDEGQVLVANSGSN